MKTPGTINELRDLIGNLPRPDGAAEAAARDRDGQLTKPAGSLGRLEDIAAFMAAWQKRNPPRCEAVKTLIFAGNHGVTRQGVSAFPAEVTAQMVANFVAGTAAINQICKVVGAELEVCEIDLNQPTADFTQAPAMSDLEFLAAIALGMEKVCGDIDLLCVGEMGIGNTTAAAAICRGLYGGTGADWAGPGTGVNAAGIDRKVRAIDTAMATHGAALGDPLEVMRRVGGRELSAIVGAVLAARVKRIPVLLDGFVASAAAAPLAKLNAGALDHCLAGHCSAEPGHRRLLERLDKAPLLDLGMRLGEASGAALAVSIVKASVAVHAGMATFDEAGVSTQNH